MKKVRRKFPSRLSLFGSRRARPATGASRRRFRSLGSEQLESRALLAGNIIGNLLIEHGYSPDILPRSAPYQNPVRPTDVNNNGGTEIADLLHEVHAMRTYGLGPIAAGEGEDAARVTYFDVNGDNMLTMKDTLAIISHLRGEAEPELVEITAVVTNANGQPINSVNFGEDFKVRILVDDLRDGQFPAADLGVFLVTFDLMFPSGLDFTPRGPDEENPTYDFPIARGRISFYDQLLTPSPMPQGQIVAPGHLQSFQANLNINAILANPPISFADDIPVVEFTFRADFTARNDQAMTQEDQFVDVAVLVNDSAFGATSTFTPQYPTGASQDIIFSNADGEQVPANEVIFVSDTVTIGAATTITNVGTPANGTATLRPDNTIRYRPNDDFFGTDTFTYTITSGTNTATATVTVTVGGVNDPPNAVDDTFSTPQGQQLTRNVLTNDTDRDGDALTVTAVNGVAGNVGVPVALNFGTVTLNANGALTYTPNQGVTDGTDTFTYTISDGQATDTATVTIRIGLPNALPDTFTVVEDSQNNRLDVTLNDEITEGGVRDLTAINGATGTVRTQHGTAQIVQDATLGREVISYTPDPDFFGTDVFEYTISDGSGDDVGTVTVTVTPVNDAPVAVNVTATTNEDVAVNIVVVANDTDVDNPNADLRVAPSSIANVRGGTAVLQADGRTVRFTPAQDANRDNTPGGFGFTYRVTDGSLTSANTATVTINVIPVNDPPQANNDQFRVIIPLTSTHQLNVLANDSIAPDQNETLRITAVTPVGQFQGTLEIINNGTAIRYTPVEGGTGTFQFDYTINDRPAGDNTGLTDTARVTLEVVDFIPSTISGRVYVDKDNDGVYDTDFESGLANVQVTLSGLDFGNSPVGQTVPPVFTNANGEYTFLNVPPSGPNGYKVTIGSAPFMVDGKETASNLDDTSSTGGPAPVGYSSQVTGNNEITIRLPTLGDVLSRNNNFAFRGLSAEFVSLADIIAQGNQFSASGLVAMRSNGTTAYVTPPTSPGWSQYSDYSVEIVQNGTRAILHAERNGVDVDGIAVALNTVLNGTGAHIKVIGTDNNGNVLVRFVGAPSDFGLPGGEGEAEEFARAADAIFAEGLD